MTSDVVWTSIRYILLAGGAWLTGRGVTNDATVQASIGAIGTLFTAAWGIYVRVGTKMVPVETAARADVPTVSPITGAHEAGTVFRE